MREEVTPETKMSALHRAAAMGHFDVCVLLLKKGADRKQKDARGLTAYDWVEQNLYSSANKTVVVGDDDDDQNKQDSFVDEVKKKKREKMLKLLAPEEAQE